MKHGPITVHRACLNFKGNANERPTKKGMKPETELVAPFISLRVGIYQLVDYRICTFRICDSITTPASRSFRRARETTAVPSEPTFWHTQNL